MTDGPLSLPVELQVKIWRYLDVTSLCAASLVCHSWHALSSDNLLWKEACVREIAGVAWTPRMLARPHKSWKRHFGVRLRTSVDRPIRRSLRNVVPRLLADAHARGATNETVQVTFLVNYKIDTERRFTMDVKLPHSIRHASSPKRGNAMAVLAPNDLPPSLEEEAAKLGVAYMDLDALKAFNRDRKKIKRWAQHYTHLFVNVGSIRSIPRLMGPQLNRMRKFPLVLPEDTPLATVIENRLRTVKLEIRRCRPDVAVGNVSMSAQELIDNVMTCVNALLAKLPSRDRCKAIQLHATRGPNFQVYSRPSQPNQGRRPLPLLI